MSCGNLRYPVIIGLCGRSGSGKGFVSNLFRKKGIESIDTDKVYREMTGPATGDGAPSECMTALVERFGTGIVSPDGSLDRLALSDIVFSKDGASALKDLNLIAHKFILKETDDRIETLTKNGHDIIIIDAPVLFESGYNEKCDLIISASAPEEVLINRIMKRDSIDRFSAKRRLDAQTSAKELSEKSDYIINTDADAAVVERDIEKIIADIRRAASDDKPLRR